MIRQRLAGHKFSAQLNSSCPHQPVNNKSKECTGGDVVTNLKKAEPPTAPVAYLETLYGSTAFGKDIVHQMKRKLPVDKPSPDDIDAYDLAAVRAIRSGDVATLRSMHQSGKSLNACNRFGESLIHMACRRGNVHVVMFLVEEAQVRLDGRDDYGRTCLHDACWTATPNLDVMDILVRKCAPELLLAQDVRGHTPFHYSRAEHHTEWVQFLQQRSQLLLSRVYLSQSIQNLL